MCLMSMLYSRDSYNHRHTMETFRSCFVSFAILALFAGTIEGQATFRVTREWRYVNYTWPSRHDLAVARANGIYNPRDISMTGIAYYDGFYYVTTPRMLPGTPATLSRFSEGNTSPGPLLEPYPSWRANRIGTCDSIQNVQNVQINANGHMYIIDSGRINTLLPQSTNLCTPKLLKYDLNVNQTIWKFEFPDSVAGSAANLYDLVLDDDYVYISDNSKQDPGLIVFSEREMTSWKIRDHTFRAEQAAMNITVNGVTIRNAFHLGGLALGPWNTNGTDRPLYYTPISSFYLYAVNTSHLKDPKSGEKMTLDKGRIVGRKNSQTDGMTMDDKGILYYGQLSINSIEKWDSNSRDFNPVIIARDPNFVQWPNSFTFDHRGDLIVLTNALQRFFTRTMNLDDGNFRLLAGNVDSKSYVYGIRPKVEEDLHFADNEIVDPAILVHENYTRNDEQINEVEAEGQLIDRSSANCLCALFIYSALLLLSTIFIN